MFPLHLAEHFFIRLQRLRYIVCGFNLRQLAGEEVCALDGEAGADTERGVCCVADESGAVTRPLWEFDLRGATHIEVWRDVEAREDTLGLSASLSKVLVE